MRRRGKGGRAVFAAVIAAVCWCSASPAWAIKILYYNLLNYPGTTAAERDPNYRLILADIQPDLVVAGEIQNTAGASAFRDNVLNAVNPGTWLLDQQFPNAGDTHEALFMRFSMIIPTGTGADRATVVNTSPRVTPRWKLKPAGYNAAGNWFYVYGAHLKAGNTQSDADSRTAAATLIRANANNFPANTAFLLAGDMNLYTSTEGAYGQFTGSQADNDGRTWDPLNPLLGVQNWSDNFTYRFMHTQSPRTVNPPGQSGGTTGGLDDRFDFIFLSMVMNGQGGFQYVPGSYRTYGQDGNRFNQAVNNPLPNGDVSNQLADALWMCSDHLPVLLSFTTPSRGSASPLSQDFGTVITGALPSRTLNVSNTAPTPGQTLSYQYSSPPPGTFYGPSGQQSVAAGMVKEDALYMDTSVVGFFEQPSAVVLNTNSLETPTITVSCSGLVVDHAVPSTEFDTQVLTGQIDFGPHPPGGFTDQTTEVYNVGYSFLQARLSVNFASFTGPAAGRFSVTTPLPVEADEEPAVVTVHFNDAGAGPGTYTATMELLTSDQTDLEGALDLETLTYQVTATVVVPQVKGDFNGNGVVDCADVPPMIAVLLNPGAATPEQRDIADMNSDTRNDGKDIQPFENVLQCP